MLGSSLLHNAFRPKPSDPRAHSEPASRSKKHEHHAHRAKPNAAPATQPKPLAAPVAAPSSPTTDVEESSAATPAVAKKQHVGNTSPRPVAGAAVLRVNGTDLPRCDVADLRPGDIGFVYQRTARNRRQRLISFGEHITNIFRPRRHGSPHVLHAFIVVDTHPATGKVLIADAAAGTHMNDITLMVMDFKHHVRVRPSASYLFYRPTNVALATRIATVARHWTNTTGAANFSSGKAISSMLHPAFLGRHAKERALYFASQANTDGPLMRPSGGTTYAMMCSEFVTNVCIAATLAQWQEGKHAVGAKADLKLTGLWDGPAGNAFAVDAKGTPPSVLQARLARNNAIFTVGYIPGAERPTGAPKPPRRMPQWPLFGRSNKETARSPHTP